MPHNAVPLHLLQVLDETGEIGRGDRIGLHEVDVAIPPDYDHVAAVIPVVRHIDADIGPLAE